MKNLVSKIDPRWILLTNHTLLLSTGILFYNLNRTAPQVVSGILVAILAELIFAKVFDKEWDKLGSRVLSAVIAALGFLILTSSKAVWYYPFGSLVAIASKYLFRYDKTHHIYNPTGFAIIFAFAAFPKYKPQFFIDTFLVATYPTVQVLILGLIATTLANRWVMSLTYYLCMLLGAGFLSWMGRHDFFNIIGPEMSVMGLVIPFFMITDPQTSPQSHRGQILWGLHYAFWNLLLKDQFVYASNFVGSFITASIAPLLFYIFKRRKTQSIATA